MMRNEPVPSIPSEWTVWAFSDTHGVASGLVTALQAAGIIDATLGWKAPARTALIGCGDYVDRGLDSLGVVSLLQRLQGEAAASGSRVELARGNHEAMLASIGDGATEWLETWLRYGGDTTLASFGCEPGEVAHPQRSAASLRDCAPGLFEWLAGMPQAVRWRDVLFVHGGPPPHHGLGDLGVTTDEHLWIRSGFFETPWQSATFEAYRNVGIERVVFGHTPQWQGPVLFHDGRSIDIDTNAVGHPRMPADARQELTLIGMEGETSFSNAHIIAVPTCEAPDSRRVHGGRPSDPDRALDRQAPG